MKLTDQTGHEVVLTETPSRMVSLVPSQTELLFDLGLEDRLLGVTKFCVHPETARSVKKIIGGTKQFRFEDIEQLKPDLIIANKEENYKEGIEYLRERYPVYTSDIYNLEDSLEMISQIGVLSNVQEKANSIIGEIEKSFELLQKERTKPTLKVAYLIWKDPIMVVGKNTFIHEMLSKCGFQNVFEGKERYPQVSMEELQAANCDYIFLSTEPFPFQQGDIEYFQEKIEYSEVELVDGEFFSWYGSRLIKAPGYFRELISKLARITEKI